MTDLLSLIKGGKCLEIAAFPIVALPMRPARRTG